MRRSILITVFSWFALLCVIGCGFFQRRDVKTIDEHRAQALLRAGNDYYSRASEKGLPVEERTDLYKKSVENYKKALQAPGIEERAKAEVGHRIRQIEQLLARYIYDVGRLLVRFDMDPAARKANALKAIPYFEEIIKSFPNTDYADISYVQLGLCYEYLEEWEEAEKAYEALVQKYTDGKGNPITPFSWGVKQALKYAKDRLGQLPSKLKLIALEMNRPLLH